MAQARKKTSGSGKKRGGRGLLLLVLGVGIGVGAVFLWQLVSDSFRNRGGIAHLISPPVIKPSEPQTEKARADTEKKGGTKTKQKYEFYTLLQNETVLPDREPVREKGTKPVKPDEGINYVLQAGAFANFEDADNLKARLALSGLMAQIQKVEVDGHSYHRVRLGPYEKVEQLDAAADQLGKLGIRALRLRVRKSG